MLNKVFFPGYTLDENIHNGVNTNIYRGIIPESGSSVILKLLNSEYPSLEAIARLKHEYSVAGNLEHENIVKILRLEADDKRLAIVFEDFGGVSLKQYLENNKPSLQLILKIAIAVTEALLYIHSCHIIHKDIKPANIIINHNTGEIKLTDFSIATRLSKETPQLANPNQLEGTLAYISPEQTGRMNRVVDYRSDFYSLGVTLYEILTGEIPFNSNDPLELVHNHIAKQPDQLKIQNAQLKIPQVLCDIVMKLMAKNAEDRYQSGKGLLADFKQCQQQLLANGIINNFIPGRLDVLSQLLPSQKLYGREEQLKQLLDAFERVAIGRSELMLVSGYSGIGKTSVINEVNKPITRARGYFISGKFDQLKRDIPYACFIQALSALIRQLLTESTDELENWKQKILAVVGGNGQVIIDVIPEVELIISKQPEVPQLSPTEAQNRFNSVFQKFVGIFAQKEHPLVIFLDDLQWVDSATLKLMQLLITDPESNHLLMIGAYRDNEVSPNHPLIQTIEEIEKIGLTINNIVLEALDLASVTQLVAETLNDEAFSCNSLAELIFNKTGGNPFFITQLLQVLYQDNLLCFDFDNEKWQWNIEEILAVGIADKSVVELVASRIEKLPKSTQEILKLAACIGDKFTLDVLSVVSGQSLSSTATCIYSALQIGLILPLNNAYKIMMVFSQEEIDTLLGNNSETTRITYKFLHDRVQQAAYSLIPEKDKQTTHLSIGKLLLKQTPPELLTENILDIVNQLNVGVDLLVQEDEKCHLANLNFIAGQKAKNSAAFEPSFNYFQIALKLSPLSSWQTNYKFILTLYEQAAESAYLIGEFDCMDKLITEVQSEANSLLDKIKTYEIQIQASQAQGKYGEVITTSINILELLGVNLPKKGSQDEFTLALVETKQALAGKEIQDLANIPEMQDANKLAAMRILASAISATSITDPQLMPVMVFKMVVLSLKYGNTSLSAFAYSWYATIICGFLGDIKGGQEFSQLALNLLERFQAKELKCKILILLNNYVNHWHDHLHKTITPLLDAYQSGIETGDSEYASYAALGIAFHQLHVGKELSKVQQTMEVYGKAISQFKQLTPQMYNNICHQGVLNLLGDSITPHRLVGALYDEEVTLEKQLEAYDYTGLFISYCTQLMLCYLFDEHELAIKKAFLAKKYSQGKGGLTFTIQFCLYDSLASLAIYENSSISEQNEIIQTVASNQEEMYKWLSHAPMNCQHKYDLVEAELCRIKGNKYQAMDLYDLAIKGAIDNGYMQEAAVANEIAGKFYLSLEKKKHAQIYITEAYYGYIKWGAIAKVSHLEEKYRELIIIKNNNIESDFDITKTVATTKNKTIGTTTRIENLLDIASVMKASEAIQGDIILESLPRTLLHIVLENAGAQKGCLILEKNSQLLIEAIDFHDKNDNKSIVLQSIPVEESPDVSQKIINYVARTKQTLVIEDAKLDPISTNCPYIQKNKCKSLLCQPIIYQGKLIGIFYLENNLVTRAFTPNRLEVIKILVSQAAVALKNAKLLANSQQLTEQYRSIFESANDGLSIYDFETNKFVAVNVATEKMYGYTNEEFSNLQPQDFMHADSLNLFAEFIDKVKAGKEFFAEGVSLHKDGTVFDVEVKSTYFIYNGKPHALSIIRDITERKQAAKLLQQKTEDLEATLNKLQQTQSKLVHTEKISSLGQMVAGVAHEVNNPVSFINGNLSHVSQYIDDLTNLLQMYQTHYSQPVPEIESEIAAIELDYLLEDLPKMVDSMKLGTARIKDIMLSLRNFSRTDGDDKREVDIHEGIETTLMILSHRTKAKPERPAIKIMKEYATLPKVACYPGQLNQVFMNLLANGIDALEESNQGKVYNEIDNVITISTAVSDEWVTISFADNGYGMNEEVRQKLFNAFFTTKPEGKGTGLGLSISHQIVTEKHGGTLECISSPGAGAKFVIRIPM